MLEYIPLIAHVLLVVGYGGGCLVHAIHHQKLDLAKEALLALSYCLLVWHISR